MFKLKYLRVHWDTFVTHSPSNPYRESGVELTRRLFLIHPEICLVCACQVWWSHLLHLHPLGCRVFHLYKEYPLPVSVQLQFNVFFFLCLRSFVPNISIQGRSIHFIMHRGAKRGAGPSQDENFKKKIIIRQLPPLLLHPYLKHSRDCVQWL